MPGGPPHPLHVAGQGAAAPIATSPSRHHGVDGRPARWSGTGLRPGPLANRLAESALASLMMGFQLFLSSMVIWSRRASSFAHFSRQAGHLSGVGSLVAVQLSPAGGGQGPACGVGATHGSRRFVHLQGPGLRGYIDCMTGTMPGVLGTAHLEGGRFEVATRVAACALTPNVPIGHASIFGNIRVCGGRACRALPQCPP